MDRETTTVDVRREILERYERLSQQGPAQQLGVGLHAGPAEARAAFLALARRFHPDTLAPENHDLRNEAQAVFVALNEACRKLGGHRVPDGRSQPPPPREERPREEVRPAPRPAPAAPAPPPPAPKAESPQERQARMEQCVRAAEAAIRGERSEDAVRLLHEALAASSAPAERRRAELLLARAYVSDPRWRRYGLTLLREVASGPSPDARALVLLGSVYRREGLHARAEATLTRALEQNPDDAEARRELSLVREGRGADPAPPRHGWADWVMRHVSRAR